MERGRKKWWRLHRLNESPFQTDVSEKVEAASAAVWTLMGVGCLRRDGGERRGESPSIISLCRSEGFCANSGLLTRAMHRQQRVSAALFQIVAHKEGDMKLGNYCEWFRQSTPREMSCWRQMMLFPSSSSF